MTFSAEDNRFGETVTIDLKPNGRDIEVTNENKAEYVE
jgi:E3 ubiquitin-protein ligase NEDD4